ncbi:MAG TPA: DNA primase [Patescibacteria group bacterium]|nr:DNA primase [Patescibacteria group bacterium]
MIQYKTPMDQVSEVRDKTDLVSLISEYIPLKKAGRNFKANCPFHQEKTPSFVISPERQIWHCFGCQKGGDAFSFVMEYEHMEFPEALRTLAKKAGVELKDLRFDQGQYSQKEKIYKLNNLASKFYNFLLTEHKIGKPALAYLLKERKLNLNLIKTYSLGFAPHDNSLSKYLMNKKNYTKEDLLDAGLSFMRNGTVFDFFRGRIMFPLSDHRGNIVGFSGRAMNDNDQPKYINTRDTVVYHKGSLFFGMDSAKEEIKEKGSAIIVEGEFDALSSFKEGIKNVVAIKGTALTENQANLLGRFTKKVILCLDQDEAGFEATKRSLASLEKNGMTINIVTLKDKDPDETLKKDPAEFKKALKDSVEIYDFLISKKTSENARTAEGKKNVTSELLPILANIQNEIVKEHYIKKLAKEIDSSYESLFKELGKIEGQKDRPVIAPIPKEKKERREILEGYYLSLILQNDTVEILKEEKEFLDNYKFENMVYERIFENMGKFLKGKIKFNLQKFAQTLPQEVAPAFDVSYLFPLPKFEDSETFRLEVKRVEGELQKLSIKKEMESLAKMIEEEKNRLEAKVLQKKFSELAALLPRE